MAAQPFPFEDCVSASYSIAVWQCELMLYNICVPVSAMQSGLTPIRQASDAGLSYYSCNQHSMGTLDWQGEGKERFGLLLSPQRLRSDHAAPVLHSNTWSPQCMRVAESLRGPQLWHLFVPMLLMPQGRCPAGVQVSTGVSVVFRQEPPSSSQDSRAGG